MREKGVFMSFFAKSLIAIALVGFIPSCGHSGGGSSSSEEEAAGNNKDKNVEPVATPSASPEIEIAQPTLEAINPTFGAFGGGTEVNLSGTNFQLDAKISIGGIECADVLVSSNGATCTTGASTTGTYDVVITNADGGSATLPSAFSYLAAPTLTAVSPQVGSLSGGASISLTGTHFVQGMTVKLGELNCLSVTVDSDTAAHCTTPASAAGSVNVQVTSLDQQTATLASGFTFKSSPFIQSVTPSIGVVGGQFQVTVRGLNFESGVTVKIGATACSSVVIDSATQLHCTAPAHSAGDYAVAVTNGATGDVFTLSNALRYSLSEPTQFKLFSGSRSSSGAVDGVGSDARFNFPTGMASDATNIYVADQNNHVIRKIVISTGAVSTIAGQIRTAGGTDGVGTGATFNGPRDVALSGTNLYVADYTGRTIRKIDLTTNTVTTLAGLYATQGDTNGTGSVARFYNPTGLALVGNDLYVSDYTRHVIRKVDVTTGAVTTYAGLAGTLGNADGAVGVARFNNPTGITTDGTDLYLNEFTGRRLRKIALGSGTVSSLAGTYTTAGGTDGVGAVARFNNPQAVATDGSYVYVADGAYTLRKVRLSDNLTTTIAGSYNVAGSLDATGSLAKFGGLYGIILVGTKLYVSDAANDAIRVFDTANSAVTTLAGVANTYGAVNGSASVSRYNTLRDGVLIGQSIYVADQLNCTLRSVSLTDGSSSTVAGSPGTCAYVDGYGLSARLGSPHGLATDGTYVFITESAGNLIRRFNPTTGELITLAGSGVAAGTDGTGSLAEFNAPRGIACDGTNLYVADYTGHIIRKLVLSTNQVTTIAGVYNTAGGTDGIGVAARFNQPTSLAVSGTNLYILERTGSRVRRMDLTTGFVETIAGLYNTPAFADGPGVLARFNLPEGLSFDGSNLYVSDTTNHALRKVSLSDYTVTTISGNPAYQQDSANTTAAQASIRSPLNVLWTDYGIFVSTRNGLFRYD